MDIPPPLPDKPPSEAPSRQSPAVQQPPPQGLDIPRIEIPDEFKEKKIKVIQELAESQELLKGFFEASEQGEHIFEQQQKLASDNLSKARDLLDRLEELEPLRKSASAALSSVQEREQQWIETESDMYRAIQPFSMPALQARLQVALSESESVSETLATSFLEGRSAIGGDGDDVADFIRNYRRERKTYHLRNERLERWKEERVRQV